MAVYISEERYQAEKKIFGLMQEIQKVKDGYFGKREVSLHLAITNRGISFFSFPYLEDEKSSADVDFYFFPQGDEEPMCSWDINYEEVNANDAKREARGRPESRESDRGNA